MPIISANVQKTILKNQFKKAYSTFSNAVFSAQTNLEIPVGCTYWTNGQLCNEVCTARDPVYNECQSWTCADGTPLPTNQNGLRDDCATFEEELFTKTLKVVKFCEKNALANGCLTDAYRGIDKVNAEQNPDTAYNLNSGLSDSNIKNKYSSWILSDGTLIIKYGTYKSDFPVYTIDINGHKGPNKWGYDIFSFKLVGDYGGIKKVGPINYATETGGKTSEQMLQDP